MFQIIKQFKKGISIKGFTLIELLVVISIITILGTFVTSAVFSGRTEARDMSRQTDLEQIKLALKLYREAYGEYPDYPDGIEIGVGNSIDQELAPFLGTVKADPLSAPGGGGEYGYWYSSNYSCKGRNRVVVMAKGVEKEKFSNYEQICGSAEGSSVDTSWLFAFISEQVHAGGGGGGGSGGGSSPPPPPRCSANGQNNQRQNFDRTNGCAIDVNALPSSLPAGGGDVVICYDAEQGWYTGPFSWTPDIGAGQSSSGERTVRVTRTTTYTWTALNANQARYPGATCSDSVTVVVAGSQPDEQVVIGCTDSAAENYEPDANQDDGSCRFENGQNNGPGMSGVFDRVLLVD